MAGTIFYLFYRDDQYLMKIGLLHSVHLVANINTTSTDCFGTPVRCIAHIVIGPVKVCIFVTPWVDGQLTNFIIPVTNYYEYRTDNFLRFTDSERNNSHLQSEIRHDLVNIYLAYSIGNSRRSGSTLLSSVVNFSNQTSLDDYKIKILNFLFPLNSSALNAFIVLLKFANQNFPLAIYDISSQLFTVLVNKNFPLGNYIYRWEAKNLIGENLTSNVYFFRISISKKQNLGR